VLACFAISRSAQAAQPPDIQNVNVFNTPFQRVIVVSIDPGSIVNQETIAIPAGKTLVVEFVSATVGLPAGEQVIQARFELDGTRPGERRPPRELPSIR
jgi:hypothetical protein